jgi:hypothetical protein
LQKEIRILKSYSRANDGGRSSTVEPQIVVLVVAGSSPVGHPASEAVKKLKKLQCYKGAPDLLCNAFSFVTPVTTVQCL